MKRHTVIITALLVGTWFIAWLVYQPGLSGPFLFDDFPNLEKIGALGPIHSWELFRAYLHSGFAGPTGRPIALASFLIDANDWPAAPEPFKATNVFIHLLIGVILFPAVRKLLQAIGRPSHEADWVALIASALWLVDPFLVSTTLYVVQRMTQLAALFCVIGIWGYLQGRRWLVTRPSLGYATMSLTLVVATLLAVFSKENGALLPLLILTIELALRFHWRDRGPDWRWKTVFLGLPALAIVAYVAMRLPGLERPIPTRDFTLLQRLLTEPRMIWSYLFNLFVPHIQTRGLYHDGIVISKSLTEPWTTLPALVGILGLGIGGWLARRRWPLVSLGILFFLAGHLLESTTIPLELYFEHRNYLPAVFLFVPAAAGLLALRSRIRPALVFVTAIALTSSYAFATWQRASIWGNYLELMLVWAKTNPHSPRAQGSAAQAWLRLGQPQRAFALLERASKEMPDSMLLTADELHYKAESGVLTPAELAAGAARIRHQPFDAQMLTALKHLVESLNARPPMREHSVILMSLLAGIRDDLHERVPVAQRYTYYLQGLLASGQGDATSAYRYLSKALTYYNSVDASLNMVSILATHHHFPQALAMLDQAQHVLKKEPNSQLGESRKTYEEEIARLRANLQQDMANPSGQPHEFGQSLSTPGKSSRHAASPSQASS